MTAWDRVPLPIAALGRRAQDAKTPEERHQAAYWAWEASARLLVSARPPEAEGARALLRATFGEWVRAARPPERRLQSGAILDAYAWLRRHGLGQSGAVGSVTPRQLLDALPAFRNKRIGHGAAPLAEVYDHEAGAKALREGLVAAWKDGIFWPPSGRLVFVESVELEQGDQRRGRVLDLSGEVSRVQDPTGTTDLAADIRPGRLYLRTEGGFTDLTPWLLFQPSELRPRVFFFNGAGRSAVNYLDFATGESITGKALPSAAPGNPEALATMLEASAAGAKAEPEWDDGSTAVHRFVRRRPSVVALVAGVVLGIGGMAWVLWPDPVASAIEHSIEARAAGEFEDAWGKLERTETQYGREQRIDAERATLIDIWADDRLAGFDEHLAEGQRNAALEHLDTFAEPLVAHGKYRDVYLRAIEKQASLDTQHSFECLTNSLAFETEDLEIAGIAERARHRLTFYEDHAHLICQVVLLELVKDKPGPALDLLRARARTVDDDVLLGELRALLILENLKAARASDYREYMTADRRIAELPGDPSAVWNRCLRAYRRLREATIDGLAKAESDAALAESQHLAHRVLEMGDHRFASTILGLIALRRSDYRLALREFDALLWQTDGSSKVAALVRLTQASLRVAIDAPRDEADALVQRAIKYSRTALKLNRRVLEPLTKVLLPICRFPTTWEWTTSILIDDLDDDAPAPDAAWPMVWAAVVGLNENDQPILPITTKWLRNAAHGIPDQYHEHYEEIALQDAWGRLRPIVTDPEERNRTKEHADELLSLAGDIERMLPIIRQPSHQWDLAYAVTLSLLCAEYSSYSGATCDRIDDAVRAAIHPDWIREYERLFGDAPILDTMLEILRNQENR